MKCFVIMPFSTKNSSSIYENWIRKAVEECQVNGSVISCHRADKSLRPGEIIADIVENLASADIVIADLTTQNPNVFYELGVRHTLRNNTILLTQDINDVPFDLRSLRVIQYKYTPDGMLELRDNIKRLVTEILTTAEAIDNPVKKHLQQVEVSKIMNTIIIPGQNTVEALVNEVATLRSLVPQLAQIIEGYTAKSNAVNNNRVTHIKNTDTDNITKYSGAWYSPESGSHFYVENIKGEIEICYCYGANDELTSYCYSPRVFNNILIANFQWVKGTASGLIYFELKAEDKLLGGWWLSRYISTKKLDAKSVVELPNKDMTKITLQKMKISYNEYPRWAKKYFEDDE